MRPCYFYKTERTIRRKIEPNLLLKNAGTAQGLGDDMAKITGTIGSDQMNGTAIDDLIQGLAGDDFIYGGDGNDEVRAGDGNDVVWADAGDDTVYGGMGDDALYGGSGHDVLYGGSGADIIAVVGGEVYGGSGDDRVLTGSDAAIVDGGSGDDWVQVNGDGNLTITGGTGFDTLDYSSAKSAIDANLSTHIVSGYGNSTVSGVENLIGSNFSDMLTGDKGANVLSGGAGDDILRGKSGADTLYGGEGNDTYVFMKKDVVLDGVHQGVDHLADFQSNDSIDIRDFFKGNPPADIDSVVKLTWDGSQTTLSVDAGGGNFVDVATFANHYLGTASNLAADNIILA